MHETDPHARMLPGRRGRYRSGMNVIEKLRQLHTDIEGASDGFKVVDAWTLAGRLLGRLPVDQIEASRVVSEKDASGLDALIGQLENPEPAAGGAPAQEFTEHELNDAMRAFRKRLKFGRLADESKLRGHYTTSGKASGIDAIEPPREFPGEIWKELARQGRLEHTGQGFYREPPGKPKLE